MKLPHFAGWHLIGAFPRGVPNDVGSWLLTHNGEALLLEVPPGLTVATVRDALHQTGTTLRFVTLSHTHWDHFRPDIWAALARAFPSAEFIHPSQVSGDRWLGVGGEPLWLIAGAKHSRDDVVTVFRGVAMTGDIELGTLASVNSEVPLDTKRRSMDWLRGFPERHGYHVHTVFSAHLNDVRESVRWADLFRYE